MENITQKLYDAFVEDYRNFLGTPSESEACSYSLYVDLFGGNTFSALESESFNLKEQLTIDLYPEASSVEDECHLSLILGGSGQGKTSFALALTKYYWDQMIISVDKSPKRKELSFRVSDESIVLPIFISLPSIRENLGEILQTFLQKRNVGTNSYSLIGKRTNVLLILDAYNEIVNESGMCLVWIFLFTPLFTHLQRPIEKIVCRIFK